MRYLYISLFLSAFALNTNAQIITTVAGNGTAGYSGDGGQATLAELNNPIGIAFDALGNLYISDYGNNRIRKVNTNETITTIAGNGAGAYGGDGGQATAAELYNPWGISIDAAGNLYIVDEINNLIRKVSAVGIISTIAGNGTLGYSGDAGQGILAELSHPTGVALDSLGNIYIADEGNDRIRMVNTSGIITTIIGNGIQGFSGDGGQATTAELFDPVGITLDKLNNIYIVDRYNNRIRMVNTSGIITTIAGNGTQGFSGDGGQATAAELFNPTGIALDAIGNLYIADAENNRVRKVNTLGIISTIVGNGIGSYSGDGGQATAAELQFPTTVALDAANNLYITDYYNNRIRKVTNASSLGIEQFATINEQVSVYPNPATTSLQVSLLAGNIENTELKVINMLGEVVMEPTTYHSQNFTVDVSQLATGVYIVELSNPSGKSVKRLIKE